MKGTPLERFEAKVLREHGPGGCWLWQAACNDVGYGQLRFNGRTGYAHRWSYEHYVGPIPLGLDLDHLCRVRHCVNPLHLEPVTRQVNLLRGNTVTAAHAAKTQCPSGHPYNEENTYTYRGGRQCRTCRARRAS